ncbi:hypothetical protein DFH29DRAFT_1010436 [Suillus ampliporus]|nr:hypothetical protein DFH29DRAFT_1010436 [Suillus ampliporus]
MSKRTASSSTAGSRKKPHVFVVDESGRHARPRVNVLRSYTITRTITGRPGQRRVAEAISHHPLQPPPPLIMDDPVTDQHEGYSHPRHQKGKPSGPSQLEAWLQLRSTVLDELIRRDGFSGEPIRDMRMFGKTLISNGPLYARWGHPFSLAIVAIVVQRPSQLHISLQSWTLVGYMWSHSFFVAATMHNRITSNCSMRVAATFMVLECFHELTLQGKLNIFDFYNALLHISDGSGVTDFTESL